jgi:hypothetical protein
MAQFVLDSSELDVDVLGPITFATATANLGSISANANADITNVVSATAALGGLTATATASVPSVEVIQGQVGQPNYIQPNFPQIIEPEKITVSIKIAKANTKLGKLSSKSKSQIDFSILDDDAEVLLLV